MPTTTEPPVSQEHQLCGPIDAAPDASFAAAVLRLLEELATMTPDTGDARTQDELDAVLAAACRRVTTWI